MQWVVNRFYLRWAGSWFPSQATDCWPRACRFSWWLKWTPLSFSPPFWVPLREGAPPQAHLSETSLDLVLNRRVRTPETPWSTIYEWGPCIFFFLLKYFLDDHPGLVRTSFIYFCGSQHVLRYQPSWELSRGANISRSPPQTYWIRNSGSGDEKSK